jgi:type I restriction enzyme S subunit
VQLSKYAQTGALPSYNASDLKIIKVKIPTGQEQKRIADFLMSLDSLIEAKNKQISRAEQWKKGLMQKMFV